MKIIFAVLIIFLSSSVAWAEDINLPKQEIQFVYINGSNNNDEKMKNWFFEGIQKTHPEMLNAFYGSPFIQEHFFKQGKYTLSKSPETFFWGDKSQKEIQALNSKLNFTQIFSPKFAQTVRVLLAHCLHDAIWVSHYRNMHPLIEDLHSQVLNDYSKNKQVVLFGYSAGAFVSYEYMFNKLPYLNPVDYYNRTIISDDFKNFVKKTEVQNTCIDALITSKLAIYSADGYLVPNMNEAYSKNVYKNLNSYTNAVCTPHGALKGIINYASPLVLFYSDISNPAYPLTYYNKMLYKYLLENDMFWITFNYADDPLGYPTSKNVSFDDIKNRIDVEIAPQGGFLYSKSDVKSSKTFIGAHTSYWSSAKKFAKSVAKAYEQGYNLYNK